MADHHHKSCEEIAKELSDELDGECSFWRKLKIRFHLFICPPCKKGHEALERTVDILGSMPDHPCVEIEDDEPV